MQTIETIRYELGALRKKSGYIDWVYYVGHFTVSIVPYDWDNKSESVLEHDKVDISISEHTENSSASFVHLRTDLRFKDYQPIQYDIVTTPNGKINFSDGHRMPIHHLCELIKYLHRLSNLTAFM